MDIKFPKVLGFLNLKSGSDAVTEANLQSAEDKIAQLEQDKSAADLKASEAEAALKLANDEKTKTAADLKTAQDKAATLQTWKDNQAQVDNRTEDDSNSLEDKTEAKAPWETQAAAAIETVKRRVGEK
ncbi:hypothetical protein GO988_23640 [Hymenobacter sp. HMF4947]|uniref:Uncharacterized protein n=1 Tax=Hymenobacter ginkgonis TaxID=2682976 RepID=A0A7K1TLQ7_9BACT|nr:hypothetical protein [Hymenobacter ginkgonis]MVN79335.1 hypothetical protein [Hymenobacter ginkgonis]